MREVHADLYMWLLMRWSRWKRTPSMDMLNGCLRSMVPHNVPAAFLQRQQAKLAADTGLFGERFDALEPCVPLRRVLKPHRPKPILSRKAFSRGQRKPT